MNRFLAAALTSGVIMAASGAMAAECAADKPRDDLTYEDAQAVYDCLAAKMQEGYAKGPKRWIPDAYIKEYRSWTRASTLPADPGVHGERYLLTYVNPVGADAYLEFKEEGAKMPAGTVIAKESFTIDAKGVGKPGPLFLMEKTAEGVSPATNDWYYMMVAPNGAPQAVDVMVACNECHSAFEGKDQLGYPEEEVRASR